MAGRLEYFIATKTTFLCGDCNEKLGRYNIEDPAVQVWDFYSEGWLAPCICERCQLSLPIYINEKRKKAV